MRILRIVASGFLALGLAFGCGSTNDDLKQSWNLCSSLPFDPGPCDAAMPVFAFVDGECVGRVYGGCQGNDNRFATIEECMAACNGAPDPNGCPPNRVARNACLSCGPAGGCGKHANVCAKICQSNTDCDGTLWYCANGACEVGGCI